MVLFYGEFVVFNGLTNYSRRKDEWEFRWPVAFESEMAMIMSESDHEYLFIYFHCYLL